MALKKLVGGVPVLQEDLDKAFAATFGPRAKCRVIVLDNQRRAQEVWQLARKNPTLENIGNLAETYSVDPTTRSLRGEVPPIRRWGGQPALEREAFTLKPGELSGVVQVADRFMVLFCEGFTEAAQVSIAEVKDELHGDLFEKKQRIEMARYFTHLRESATIDNLLAGTSQSPTKPATGRGQPGQGPASTLTKVEAGELAKPRTGSVQPPASSAVVPASLDAPMGDGDDSHLFGEIIQDDNAETPYEQLEEKTVSTMLRDMVKTLPPREATILTYRFGLDGGPERTLEEVGQKFGVTRERVRQIQNLALHKLRRMIERREAQTI